MSFSGNTLLDNQADHVLAMFSGNTFTATQNYWGTTDTAVIDQMIYDTADDLSFGNVLYSPFLTAADPDAPAILTEVVLTPQSPVGIQEVAFELNFSTPMDHSQNPQVSFRGAPPDDENNYVVSDNAQWLDENTWRATYDITSLLPRGPYHLTVSNARGLDGLTMWPDQNFTFAVDYAIQITDQSPPLAPTLMATGTDGVPGELAASWQATDAESTVVAYRYAVGSAPGAVDIINWTITTSTGVARSGLGLTNGQTYYVSVQAQNSGGLWSPVVAAAFTAGMKTVYGVLLPLLMR
jgi:hypothetical protein